MNKLRSKLTPKSNHSFLILNCLIFSFALLILASNLHLLRYGCINANDFSIYQQGIYKISNFNEFNPFSSIRDMRILSDHFDPIIYFPAVLVKIFGASPFLLFLFEWLLWPIFSFIIYRCGNYKWNTTSWLKAFALIIFSKSLLYGFFFPVHPTTWSLIPIAFLCHYLKDNNNKGVLISAISLLLFKEIFIFMLIGLSSYYLFNKKLKMFIILFLTGVISYYAVFILRTEYYGAAVNYGNSTLSNFLKSPFSVFWSALKTIDIPYKMILPSLLLINKSNYKAFLPIFLLVLPAILIHILAGRIVHHHSVVLVTPFLVMGLLTTKIHVLIVIAFLATGIGRFTKATKNIFNYKLSNCSVNNEKLNSIENVKNAIFSLPSEFQILASGSIIPRILTPANTIFQIDHFTLPRERYDVLALEKNKAGDPYPMTQEKLDRLIFRCRSFSDEILYEDNYAVVMKGNFTQECVKHKSIFDFSKGFRTEWMNDEKPKN